MAEMTDQKLNAVNDVKDLENQPVGETTAKRTPDENSAVVGEVKRPAALRGILERRWRRKNDINSLAGLVREHSRLIAAMRNTMQDHLANLIEYGNEYGGSVAAPVLAPVSSVFRGFITTVSRLKPIEKQSERCERSFITSVATYSNAFPKSELSVREIPFVMAIKLGSYAEADVLSWPNAPGKAEYDRQAAIYERETAELMELLRVLEDGGIHLVVKPRDERIYKLVETLRKPFIGVYGRAIHLMLSLVQIKHLSQTDINAITCLVHLMCFDNVNFVIRKTAVPKPNSYLLYNAGALINSTIVMDRDRQWLRDAATTDESVVIVGQTGTVCPW